MVPCIREIRLLDMYAGYLIMEQIPVYAGFVSCSHSQNSVCMLEQERAELMRFVGLGMQWFSCGCH